MVGFDVFINEHYFLQLLIKMMRSCDITTCIPERVV